MPSEQLEMLIGMLQANPLHQDPSFPAQRARLDAQAGGAPLPVGAQCAPVDANGVGCEWVTAGDSRADAAVLYLHGGGYCIGSIVSHRAHAARMAAVCRARVLNVDYRLAPEAPFPAAVDDAVAAYRWLRSQDFAPNRIVIAGDSAGGGLTVATLIALRDAGEPLPAGGVCISPWTDLTMSGESMHTKAADDPMCRLETLGPLAAAYLGGQDARTPLASPLFADLRGLPPLLLHVGTRETLLDDALRLEARGRAAGVAVTCEAWPGMIHVWHLFAPLLPEADEALAKVGAFVQDLVPG